MKKRKQGRLKSISRSQKIDLGLAISGALLSQGAVRTQQEIAHYCDCTRSAICIIERAALLKLRRRIEWDQLLTELVEQASAA